MKDKIKDLLNTPITQQMWDDSNTNPNNPICLIDKMMDDVCLNEYSIWDWDRVWLNSIGEMEWDEVCEYFNNETITIGKMISYLMSYIIYNGGEWYYDDRQYTNEWDNDNKCWIPTNLTDDEIMDEYNKCIEIMIGKMKQYNLPIQ